MIKKILIANRGEIACRIARTCKSMGIAVAAVYSAADQHALHVRDIGEAYLIGGAAPSESYLNKDAIIEAAKSAGADAIHPGYGFLSEDPAFAEAVEAAGLIFIGPTADILQNLGRKDSAKILAKKAGIPVIPGTDSAISDPKAAEESFKSLGFPLLLKAAAGGGGRGMRIVNTPADLSDAIQSAMREAESAFGSPALIGERFVDKARHIEVQIAGDGKGNVIHLYERECTLQRRHQKVIEEAPAAPLQNSIRQHILDHACALGREMNFRNLGTVEFIVSGDEFFFLEVNPRLQVEHPVTEEVTGLDLVALQIQIANGQSLPLTQEEVTLTGHAVEARLYAEDPTNNFGPSTGEITYLSLPHASARIEAGVAVHDSVTPFYDPMIAKIVTTGDDREQAFDAMDQAIQNTQVHGLSTNLNFLAQLTRLPETRSGTFWTTQIDQLALAAPAPVTETEKAFLAAVWLWENRRNGADNPWSSWGHFSGWQLGTGQGNISDAPYLTLSIGEDEYPVHIGRQDANGTLSVRIGEVQHHVTLTKLRDGRLHLTDGRTVWITDATICGADVCLSGAGREIRAQISPLIGEAEADIALDGTLEAPLMGKVIEIRVKEQDNVAEGDIIAIMESMKMEVRVQAPSAGIVTSVTCQAGDMLERGDLIAEITPANP